jgi:hypothetical protein
VYKKINIVTKDAIGLQEGDFMVAQVDTKKLRLIIIGFETPTNDKRQQGQQHPCNCLPRQ